MNQMPRDEETGNSRSSSLQQWPASGLLRLSTKRVPPPGPAPIKDHCPGPCLLLVSKLLKDRDSVLFTDVFPKSSKISAGIIHLIVSVVLSD